jgi:hypothetical protein
MRLCCERFGIISTEEGGPPSRYQRLAWTVKDSSQLKLTELVLGRRPSLKPLDWTDRLLGTRLLVSTISSHVEITKLSCSLNRGILMQHISYTGQHVQSTKTGLN